MMRDVARSGESCGSAARANPPNHEFRTFAAAAGPSGPGLRTTERALGRSGILTLAALVAACRSGGVDDPPRPDAGAVATIAVPATRATFTASLDLSVEGQGTGDLAAISLSHGIGSVVFRGAPANALFFLDTAVPTGTATPSPEAGTLDARYFEIVAEQEGRLIVIWLLCSDGALTDVYYETTDGIASTETQSASGSCRAAERATVEEPAWSPFAMRIGALVAGFSVSGEAGLSFDGTRPGTVTLGDAPWSLYPFHVVDCSACATPGWFELHTIMWSPDHARACLAVMYLSQAPGDAIEIAYTLCIPDLESPIPSTGLFLPGSWTRR